MNPNKWNPVKRRKYKKELVNNYAVVKLLGIQWDGSDGFG